MNIMDKKTNPWMLATFLLLGLIIGFGLGMFAGKNAPQSVPSDNFPQGTPGTTGTDTTNNANAPATKVELMTSPSNTYANLQVEKDGDHWTLGSKTAKVKFIEYSDFQCPFCKSYFTLTLPQILKDYVAAGKIYYEYYNLPLDIHPQAPKAAEAASCAGEQNKYWEYHDLLFLNQNSWAFQDTDIQTFKDLAASMELDTNSFNQCLDSGKFANLIEKDKQLGATKGISGTPTFFINDQKIVGAQDYSVFKSTIDLELKK